MKERTNPSTWSEIAMYGAGGVSGTVLGVLTAIWLNGALASQSPIFWFISRAAGVVAYFLLWLSTAWGITVSSKGIGGRISGVLAYAMHNVTSWLGLGFGLVHAVSLLGDMVVPFSVPAILVPFAASYRPFLTGLGTLSLYLGVIVTAAFYYKKQLGYRVWRTIHGLSYAMFVSVTLHSILLGTDSSTGVMRAIYLVAGVSVALLTVFRVITATSGKGPAAGTARADQRSAA